MGSSTLRTMGNKRPVSIIQLRSNARNKYARFNVATMTEMLSIARRDENGIVIAKRNNPAVLHSTLQKIARLMGEGMPHGQVCQLLRTETVPEGYQPHPWIVGHDETPAECLRSILAQMEFHYQVCKWHE